MVELKQGSTLKGGKYKIVKMLGQGTFGITYLAQTRISMDGQLGKMDVNVNVTIKEFFMSDLNNRSADGTNVEKTSSTLVKNYLSKFRREAENLAKLHHPNIVKVLEVFDENNTTYYVMEYIDGETIDDLIKSKGHLSEREALDITRYVCAALSYMHEHKMLHLDLKPKNLMRNSEGKIFLIDFGLAKQYTEDGEPESSTSIGLGTPGYAPIEQANYKKDGSFPVTLDIYALGASLYKMLVGKTPPEASSVLNEGLPLSQLKSMGVSDGTIDIVKKAMAPMKKERYQSVQALSLAIKNSEAGDTQDDEERTSYDDEPEIKTSHHPSNKAKVKDADVNNSKAKMPAWVEKYGKYGAVAILLMVGAFFFFSNRNGSPDATFMESKTDSIASLDSAAEMVDHHVLELKESANSMPAEVKTEIQQEKKKLEAKDNPADSREVPSPTQPSTSSGKVESTSQSVAKPEPAKPVEATTSNNAAAESQATKADAIYEVVDEPPSFPGGDAARIAFLSNNLRYPAVAMEQGIQGRVVTQFVVDKDGSITDVKVVRSLDPMLDKEAVRLVKSMPKWTPGKLNGSPVRVKYILPLSFRLEE